VLRSGSVLKIVDPNQSSIQEKIKESYQRISLYRGYEEGSPRDGREVFTPF